VAGVELEKFILLYGKCATAISAPVRSKNQN
jgi:hypothetical protein